MEFGSDFHKITDYPKGKSIFKLINRYRLYADGRQALEAVLFHENIKRVWLPSYYCHESVESIKRNGIKIVYYPCTPESDQDASIRYLPLEHGDALVRMNFFGIQSKPKTPYGHFILIEDHSHNLISDWSLNSEADWCFASLRKSLPVPDGGIIWSQKCKNLPTEPGFSQLSYHNSFRRNTAMELKRDFLAGKLTTKDIFLSEYRITEDNFGYLPISSISNVSKEIVEEIDISEWYRQKNINWKTLVNNLRTNDSYRVFSSDSNYDTPFSLILLFNDNTDRERVRRNLIANEVYPAVLWTIPKGNDIASIDFGNRILSIHCDARYNTDDMIELANRINLALEK